VIPRVMVLGCIDAFLFSRQACLRDDIYLRLGKPA
jgi:hypothetical protein